LVITASEETLFGILALKKKFINIEIASNQKVVDKFLKNIFDYVTALLLILLFSPLLILFFSQSKKSLKW